jgi:anti-sigma factor RsiW
MTCQELQLDLGDFADGSIADDRRAIVERHLAACAACRALLMDLQTMAAAARTLEPQLPPPQLYTRIAAAVGAEPRRVSAGRWFDLGTFGWQSALSAAAVAALLIGGSWLAFRDAMTGEPRPRTEVARVEQPIGAPLEPVGTALTAAEQHYTDAIASLEQIANSGGSALDRPTAAVVKENLAVVDQAIGESRQALKQDPSSGVAQESLFQALQSKVTLLQETVALINEMRNGNPDAAARIISGINQ